MRKFILTLGVVWLAIGATTLAQIGIRESKEARNQSQLLQSIRDQVHHLFPKATQIRIPNPPSYTDWGGAGPEPWGPWLGETDDAGINNYNIPFLNSAPSFYQVDFSIDGHLCQAFFDDRSRLILWRRYINANDLPVQVKEAVEADKHYSGLDKKNVQEIHFPNRPELFRLSVWKGPFRFTHYLDDKGAVVKHPHRLEVPKTSQNQQP